MLNDEDGGGKFLKKDGGKRHTFVASHLISEQPCATRAAMQLLPRFIPSTMPAAIASTFFKAPAISTPVTSLIYHTSHKYNHRPNNAS